MKGREGSRWSFYHVFKPMVMHSQLQKNLSAGQVRGKSARDSCATSLQHSMSRLPRGGVG
ncbi:MAG: hypothetical protein PWR07_1290 [Bacillota bacterium]|nr:hypothetical protein [Bacillota bacterium]